MALYRCGSSGGTIVVDPFIEYFGNQTLSATRDDLFFVVAVVPMTFTGADIVQYLLIRPSNIGIYGYVVRANNNTVKFSQKTQSTMMIAKLHY